MEIDVLRNYCLSLPETTEELPFGPDTLVFKVNGKMFALTNLMDYKSVNLKCEPEKAIELRDAFDEVKPGYHMNKKHWNTISTLGRITNRQFEEWILDSYRLVVNKMKKADKERILKQLNEQMEQ